MTPVSLLTGFLGSGKTTLLAKLLHAPAMKDAAVIINEFGEVGLDHLLIERGQEDVVLLDSGCLCCAISGSLGETLADLHYRRVRGEIPAFTRVLIETSGLADPAPILQLLLTDREVTQWYGLDGVVTTVDGQLGEAQLDRHEEARRQVAMADLLILTKVDVSPPAALDRLEARLREINPRALRLRAVNGDVPAERLVGVSLCDAAMMAATIAPWLAIGEGAGATAHHHDDDIETYSAALAAPMAWPDYVEWLVRLRSLPAEKLLRVKGIVALGDERAPHVVQGVQHVFGHPAPLVDWPWGDRTSRLVFIVQGIPLPELEAMLGRQDAIWSGGHAAH